MFEDKNTEFKSHKSYDINMVAKYICGFLNAKGGVLYLGITDGGKVVGCSFDRKKRDEFQCALDMILTNFSPRLLNDECKIIFSPVYNDRKRRELLLDCYVVEIHVMKHNEGDLCFTHLQECWIRLSGSLKKLSPIDIR